MPRLDISFPTEKEKLARDVAEFSDSTSEERIRALLELAEICEKLRAASPQRERQIELLDQLERIEHERLKEMIRKNVRRDAGADASR